jgi:hypothetical protein
MTTNIAVMLIWIGNYQGGAATITFDTLEACRAAEPVIQAEFGKVRGDFLGAALVKTKCVEVRK